MKLGFVFDTKFKKFEDNYYSTNLSSEFLENRYLKNFDEMVIVSRYEEISEESVDKYLQSNSEKIKFDAIKNENPLKRVLHFKRDSKYIERILDDCDAVICRGWRGTEISKRLKKKYLVEVVNCAWDAYWNHGFLGKVVAPIIYSLRKISTYKAPYVLYVTNEFLQNRYPSSGQCVAISDVKLENINNAILERRINKLYDKDAKIIMGTAAAIDVPYKGQKYVISAIAKLKKEGFCNYEYHLAGGGNRKKLQKFAKKMGVENQIYFWGNIPHDKIFEWYDALDIYIQPSLQEGLPRALIEAMSRGVFCLGSKTGGIPELLEKQYVCDNNIFLADKLKTLILKYDKDTAMMQAIRNVDESKKYSKDLLEKKWEEFFGNFYVEVRGEKNG